MNLSRFAPEMDQEVLLTGPSASCGEVPVLEAISWQEVSVSSHNLTPQEG